MSQEAGSRNGSPMVSQDWRLRAARDELLRSTVRFARLIFDAYACSVFLYRPENETLVLEATSEQLEDRLLSIEIPAHSGVAGWVFQAGEALALDDLTEVPQFDRVSAEATGYVPTSMLVAPLEMNGNAFGVMEILDPARQVRGDMETLDLLEELARQCCASLAALGQVPSLSSAETADDPSSRLLEDIHRLAEAGGRESSELIAALRAVVQAMASREA